MIEMYLLMSIQTLLETNLSISIENIIILLTAGGCIISAAKDPRIAMMVAVLLYVSEFIIFYEMGIEWVAALVAFLITIVLLSVSLLMPYQTTRLGVI